MRGLFITCEGPEGSGKSTHSRALAERLRGCGLDVVQTREPGGTPTGEAIRQLLQHNGAGEDPVAAAGVLLFCASRAQLTAQVIAPALARGAWVICDRFTDSTLAYQGYGRGFDLRTLRELNAFATAGLTHDLTLLFEVDTATGFRRLQARAAASQHPATTVSRRVGRLSREVRAGFLDLAAKDLPFPHSHTTGRATRIEEESGKSWRRLVRRANAGGTAMRVDEAFCVHPECLQDGPYAGRLLIGGDTRGAAALATQILQCFLPRAPRSLRPLHPLPSGRQPIGV